MQKSVFYFFIVALKLFAKFNLEIDQGSSLKQISEYAEKYLHANKQSGPSNKHVNVRKFWLNLQPRD